MDKYIISIDEISRVLDIVRAWEMRACNCDIMYGWHCNFHSTIYQDLEKIEGILKGTKQDG